MSTISQKPHFAVLATLALAACLAACGNTSTTTTRAAATTPSTSTATTSSTNTGSSSTAVSSGGTSRSSLVAEADTICRGVVAESAGMNAAVGAAKSEPQLLATLVRIAPERAADERRAIERLSKLKVPATLAAEWTHLLTDMNRLANDVAQIGTDAETGQYQSVLNVDVGSSNVQSELAALATRDGFRYCGHSG